MNTLYQALSNLPFIFFTQSCVVEVLRTAAKRGKLQRGLCTRFPTFCPLFSLQHVARLKVMNRYLVTQDPTTRNELMYPKQIFPKNLLSYFLV